MDPQRPAAASAIVWREPSWQRVPALYGAVPLLLLLVVVSVLDPLQPYSWALGALFAVNLAGELRRRCTLDRTTLSAQGRFARRSVELEDLRQVGMGLGYVWVQTHHPLDERGGTILSLRMIPRTKGSGQPSGMQAVGVIRARALAAGATLDEAFTKPTHPPRNEKKPLIFSI